MDEDGLIETMAAQDGVVSRAQVRDSGGSDPVIRRRLRRREWARVHEGVYVDHTGPLTWRQRAWAAVLLHDPAALAGVSALRASGLAVAGEPAGTIEVAVDRSRRVDDPPGVRTRQVADLDAVALTRLSPPRLRVEHAALDVASRARSDDAAVAALAEVVRCRATTPDRLRRTLEGRPRLRRRALLRDVLSEVGHGAHSAMERRYLRDVERAHRLPVGVRQRPDTSAGGRAVYRDVEYVEQLTVMELDGRLGHERTTDRWADLDRDLQAAAAGRLTLRAGWGQVLQPCRLAAVVETVLQRRGWSGAAQPCGPGCELRRARIAAA